MDSENHLKQLAIGIANDLQDRASGLNKELAEVKTRAAMLEHRIQSANLSRERALSFEPSHNGELQCPRCWVLRDVRADMKPIDSPSGEDFFRCKNCQFEISIEY